MGLFIAWHKSYCIWSSSHRSVLVPSAFDDGAPFPRLRRLFHSTRPKAPAASPPFALQLRSASLLLASENQRESKWSASTIFNTTHTAPLIAPRWLTLRAAVRVQQIAYASGWHPQAGCYGAPRCGCVINICSTLALHEAARGRTSPPRRIDHVNQNRPCVTPAAKTTPARPSPHLAAPTSAGAARSRVRSCRQGPGVGLFPRARRRGP